MSNKRSLLAEQDYLPNNDAFYTHTVLIKLVLPQAAQQGIYFLIRKTVILHLLEILVLGTPNWGWKEKKAMRPAGIQPRPFCYKVCALSLYYNCCPWETKLNSKGAFELQPCWLEKMCLLASLWRRFLFYHMESLANRPLVDSTFQIWKTLQENNSASADRTSVGLARPFQKWWDPWEEHAARMVKCWEIWQRASKNLTIRAQQMILSVHLFIKWQIRYEVYRASFNLFKQGPMKCEIKMFDL